MGKKFRIVAVGGTFDELHKGHRALLMKAFEVGEQVLIGISSDKFAEKLCKPHVTAPYSQRLAELKAFLTAHQLLRNAEIICLNDPYGVTLSEGAVDALLVSEETEPAARAINVKRKAMGLDPLEVVVIDMIPSENHSAISTTRIRRGEIDREGHVLKD